MPVALSCCAVPAGIEELAGVTARETRVGAVTVRLAEPLMVPEAALILVVPGLRLVANPPLLTLATVDADELHTAELVRFCVVPSV